MDQDLCDKVEDRLKEGEYGYEESVGYRKSDEAGVVWLRQTAYDVWRSDTPPHTR